MRILRAGLGLLVLALLGLAGLLFGFLSGWFVERLEPGSLSALLRPSDELFVPEGQGPFPAVVQFHGCGGVFENQREWASAFRDAGWVAVVVDSNTPRGLDAHEVCGGRALLGAERAGDVWVSLADVKRLPFVDPERVILAGWSHGAWSIMDLLAMTAGDELPHNLVGPPVGGMAGVAGLIFIYPYCGAPARAAPWSLDAPSLFVIAGADSVAPPEDCLDLADELTDVGHDVSVRTLAGVDHAFDEDHGPDDYLPFDPEATAQAHAYALEFAARIDSGASRAQEN